MSKQLYLFLLILGCLFCSVQFVSSQAYINRQGPITSSEVFGIRKNLVINPPFTSYFGGMYVETNNSPLGKPFYGYAIDSIYKAYHYYDGETGSWRLFNNGERLSVTPSGNVGIGITSPFVKLMVDGAITLGDNVTNVQAPGTIRWNPDTEDFEGYTGTRWKSLTRTTDQWGTPVTPANIEDQNFNPGSGLLPNQRHGSGVGISGNYAIAGTPGDAGNSNDEGAAYIYEHQNGAWAQMTKISAIDAETEAFFGSSVAISGNLAIVGAPGATTDGETGAGAAYVFELQNGTWVLDQELAASDASNGDSFGESVAISGNYAIVGARYDDDAGSGSGAAYVFVRTNGNWSQQQKLTASDAANGDEFGCSVSISGDFAIVGAFNNDDAGQASGSVYIFKRENSTWPETAKLTASDAGAGDYFGNSVSISGEYAIVGARRNDDAGFNSGSAYVFVRTSLGWQERQKLTASDAFAQDQFGRSVSISGDYVIVGAHLDDDNAELNSGSAYVFRRDGNMYYEQTKLRSSKAQSYAEFGASVAIDGTHILVGAPLENYSSNQLDVGWVYFFSK